MSSVDSRVQDGQVTTDVIQMQAEREEEKALIGQWSMSRRVVCLIFRDSADRLIDYSKTTVARAN